MKHSNSLGRKFSPPVKCIDCFFSDSARDFTLFRIFMHPKLCAQIAAQWTTIHIYWLLCPSHA